MDDESLPDVWGLPAITKYDGESDLEAAQRVAPEKLGVETVIDERIGTTTGVREDYCLELTDYYAHIVDGVPQVPHPGGSQTQYVDWRFTSKPEELIPAARAGSLCSQVYLSSLGVEWSPGGDGVEAGARDQVWDEVADSILAAEDVTIVGIAPISLVGALVRMALANPDSVRLSALNYVTSAPETVPAALTSEPETVHQKNRWLAGYQGMVNVTRHIGSRVPEHSSSVTGVKNWFQNCVVRIRDGDQINYWQISYLSGGYQEDVEELCCVSHLPGPTDRLDRYFRATVASSVSFRLREVSCFPTDEIEVALSPLPTLRIKAFEEYHRGDYDTRQLWPITLIMARYRKYEGPYLLLRRRTQLTDRDDFGLISLLSSRVTADDVAMSMGVHVHGLTSEKTLDKLWHEHGASKPRDLVVSEDIFRIAAGRLALDQLGLQLDLKRFTFVGYSCLERENTPIQLGFAIFLLDLRTGFDTNDGADEMEEAKHRSGSSLELVDVTHLNTRYDELNRCMKAHLPQIIEVAQRTD